MNSWCQSSFGKPTVSQVMLHALGDHEALGISA